jgi:hypothetical protein
MKTAIPFLVGTKFDHLVNFPREDQEEITKQVLLPLNDGLTTGTPICPRHESESHFLFNESFYQRSKGTLSELLSLS